MSKPNSFRWSTESEPHKSRTKEIIHQHPEIRTLIGRNPYTFLIAGPLAWFVMHSWLLDFSYRTSLSWWIFVVAGLLSLIIALFTVSIQSLKAALANPARSLRSE
jgi:hypothetical protein